MQFSLWPAQQLLVTADTAFSITGMLHPREQSRFLEQMSAFAGPDIFANSLVYSTPHGNTGWTALTAGSAGHVTYHHWDAAAPSLLQLDVFGLGIIDESAAIDVVKDFWVPTGQHTVLVDRPSPDKPLRMKALSETAVPRAGSHEGLGPGAHLHLLLDQVAPAPDSPITASTLDNALIELVSLLKMRCLTSAISNHHQNAYNGVIGITTSHISLRVRQDAKHIAVCLDVFSCRNFDHRLVHGWLGRLFPTPTDRRSVLYNRTPKGTFEILSQS